MIIGIDVGGTKIAAGLVHEGEIIQTERTETGKEKGKEHVLGQLQFVIDELSHEKEITGIGIGIPGYAQNGILKKSIQCLNGVDIKKALHLEVPLSIANDANCFVLGEHRYGVGKETTNLIGVTLGTGVGVGLVLNGTLYEGSHGRASEMGHWIKDIGAHRYAAYHNENDWETLLRGSAIIDRYLNAGGDGDVPSAIWEEDSNAAQKTREETARLLAIFCSNIDKSLDPDMIVIGGGVANKRLVEDANEKMPDFGSESIIRLSKLKENAAILGAASLLD